MKNRNKIIRFFLCIFLFILASCNGKNEKEIIIFHAGSLSVPLKQITREYMKSNPGINIKLEGAGSVACARKITEIGKPCDILATADYKVIEKFLMPEYTDWNIWFATNEMVIAYHDKSAYSDIIGPDNWHEILGNDDVVFGRADPDADPCGYRTVMLFKLASEYYGNEKLAAKLIVKDVNMIRPKGVDLVALLETKALDYIIEYRSICEQHGLQYIKLPPELNLSDPNFENLYGSVSVDITGNKPGEKLKIKGSSMIYGITLLDDAPNRKEALDFLYFFLGERGRDILRGNGQSPISLYLSGNTDNIPEKILGIFKR
ncbi:MAG TPA: tungstate ABC transporter substrate-binding protein WtpA [Bacteroidales bacterium]|nr:tungstate ABC transporter substrate-binding protein WtpA [Bacteroidales bacterium]